MDSGRQQVKRHGEDQIDHQHKHSDEPRGSTVARDEGAIGYIGIAFVGKWASKVNTVGLSEKGGSPIYPTVKTVSDGSYPLFRYLFMVTRGKAKGEVGDFIKFAQSAEGQKIVAEVGYVSLR